jgi:hypothetical protein
MMFRIVFWDVGYCRQYIPENNSEHYNNLVLPLALQPFVGFGVLRQVTLV